MAKSTSRRTGSKKKPARIAPARKVSRRKAVTPAKPAASAKRAAAPGKPAKASAKGKWVYRFGNGKAEGRPGMRDLLGGKGAGLAEMANLGLPVPPGFTITTEVCRYYYENDKTYPPGLQEQVETALAAVGRPLGRSFGDRENPLLVSVRSGARASMP